MPPTNLVKLVRPCWIPNPKYQRQSNPFNCLATCFGMCMGHDVVAVCSNLGFTGNEPNWPDGGGRGHHLQELIDYAIFYSYRPVIIDARPVWGMKGRDLPINARCFNDEAEATRLGEYMSGTAILIGYLGPNYGHAIVSANGVLFDPRGEDVDTSSFILESLIV